MLQRGYNTQNKNFFFYKQTDFNRLIKYKMQCVSMQAKPEFSFITLAVMKVLDAHEISTRNSRCFVARGQSWHIFPTK